MAEPLKHFFSPALVRRIARSIAAVEPSFPERAFVRDASRDLESLELLARAARIAEALAEHLPPEYPQAIAVLLRSLGPPHATDELVGAGMAPFFYLPHTMFVAERGLEHFDLSLDAQVELTKRFTAEGSIRAFLLRDPERTLAAMRRWARDGDPHVRRLVSEGTRLRLPWAKRVPWLDAHPERVVALLDVLKDDPASLVRRSVANSLNDLSKVHPALANETCAAWLRGASEERRALVEHALRSAVKRGDPAALATLGFGSAPKVTIGAVRLEPRRVPIGGRARVSFELASSARGPQSLLVDLAVHFVKARGTSRKVFKLRRVELPPRGRVVVEGTVSLAVHTTRKPRPGRHAVEVLVNGVAHPLGAFEVVPASAKKTSGVG